MFTPLDIVHFTGKGRFFFNQEHFCNSASNYGYQNLLELAMGQQATNISLNNLSMPEFGLLHRTPIAILLLPITYKGCVSAPDESAVLTSP